MKNLISTCFCFLFSTAAFSQSAYQPLQTEAYHIFDRLEIKSGRINDSVFTSVKPYNRKAMRSVVNQFSTDSTVLSKTDLNLIAFINRDNWLYNESSFEMSKNPLLKKIYKSKTDFFAVDVPDFRLRLNPVLYDVIGKDSNSDNLVYTNTRGVEIEGLISKKLAFYTYLTENQARVPNYVQDKLTNNFKILPGGGLVKPYGDGTAIDFSEARGYISFQAIRHVNIQFGNDRNFIGNGFRSMIQSDAGNSNLFLKLNTKVWKLNYTNLFFELTDVNGVLNNKTFPKKFAAVHHLSVNLNKNLNVGLFENIIFSNDNGFDLNYLNPIIFYRNVEFYLGSPHNASLGADFKYNFLKRFSAYGQLFVDEFKFAEVTAGDGWWANKFGYQLGLKYIDVANINNLDLQIEYNAARPYTYTHFNTQQSYSHYSQPLAHPLGANFKEYIAIVRYQPIQKLTLKFTIISASFGADSGGLNYGSNILLKYTTRIKDYGNETLQGVATQLTNVSGTVSYQLRHNLYFDLSGVYRKLDSEINARDTESMIITGGLRLNIAPRNYDF